MYNKAMQLVKEGTAKHKGIFFYINKNKKLGIHPPKKTGGELIKAKKTIKKARRSAKARGRG
jgi:hypothetical protein